MEIDNNPVKTSRGEVEMSHVRLYWLSHSPDRNTTVSDADAIAAGISKIINRILPSSL